MGELHLEIIVDRMLREYNVQANVGRPQVAYRETIRKKALAEGKYIKQTGGKGQYGHCKIELHPLPSSDHENMKELSTDDLDALAKSVTGSTPGKWKFDKEHRFLFIDKIVGGSIPREFIPPIEAGIREALDNGILAGFTMVDVAVVLIDGSYHDVDSNEMAFKIAGSMAFKEACARAKPVLLEPIMKVEVVVPEEYMAAGVRRPELPPFRDSGHGKSRRQQRDSRGSSPRADVWLCHGFAQPHAGTRHVHHAFFALCGIARGACRGSRSRSIAARSKRDFEFLHELSI